MDRYPDSFGPGIPPRSDTSTTVESRSVTTTQQTLPVQQQGAVLGDLKAAGNNIALQGKTAIQDTVANLENKFPTATAEFNQLGSDLRQGASEFSSKISAPPSTGLREKQFVSSTGGDLLPRTTTSTTNITKTEDLNKFRIPTEGLPVSLEPAPELSTGVPAETLIDKTLISSSTAEQPVDSLNADSRPSSLMAAQAGAAQGKEGLLAPTTLSVTETVKNVAAKPKEVLGSAGSELVTATKEEFIQGESVTQGTSTVPSLPLEKVGAVVAASAAVLASGMSNFSHKVAEALPTIKARAGETVEMVRENAPKVLHNAQLAAESASEKIQETVPQITSTANAFGTATKEKLNEVATQIQNVHLGERVKNFTAPMTEAASELGTMAKEAVQTTSTKVSNMMPGHGVTTEKTVVTKEITREEAHRHLPLYRTQAEIDAEANTIGSRIQAAVGSVEETAAAAFSKIKDTAGAAVETVRERTNSAIGTVKDTADQTVTSAKSLLPNTSATQVTETVKEEANDTLSTVKSAVPTTTSTVTTQETELKPTTTLDTGSFEHKIVTTKTDTIRPDADEKVLQALQPQLETSVFAEQPKPVTEKVSAVADNTRETIQEKLSQVSSLFQKEGSTSQQRLPTLAFKQQGQQWSQGDLSGATLGSDTQNQPPTIPPGLSNSATPGLAAISTAKQQVSPHSRQELPRQL